MLRRTVYWLFAAILAYVHVEAIAYAFGLWAAQPIPTWWLQSFATRQAAFVSWVIPGDTLVLLLVATPFAWLLNRYYLRHAIPLALVISLVTAATDMSGRLAMLRLHPSAMLKILTLTNTIELIAILPLVVIVLRHLPSNNRFDRDVASGAPVRSVEGR
jgi:hypothetical protein